ncbi:penicillin-binding transpeptidase domain-containing protein [Thalassotalea sp. 1_MG-2023]|uniref:peptidoglycan D,D-transpeptidase FtsI family protein n=1 Tax=Thalassotalea sp. 1_MG-2023 TaxID=3062680 RepID=UPI0026E48526|nr:penicillin-binding transpeptidase domain-containing protein [Thalassotalea sp. 1_MG-2023]MDO6427176.1 penicillin-binding transpeptidase domain-containing protein [Thalassotalea sp. 1_MG-2023]
MVKKVSKYKQMTASWRFYLVIGVIVLVYLGLTARTAYIQVIEPDMLKQQGDMRSLRTAANKVHRGSIVDRNGVELAVSVPVDTVWADPKIIMEQNALAKVEHWQALADVLDKDVNSLKSRVTKNPAKRFVYIERQVSPAMADYIKQLKIPGIHLRKESKRFYPAGEISAHVVGFTNVDDKGIEGVERVYDDLLTGEQGSKRYRKDAKGNRIEVLETVDAKPPQDLVLSLDQRIQALAYRELKGAVKAFNASSGSVVVADVDSGEVLALANSPSYNPNNRRNVALHRLRNRAITDFYEPGSTMKPMAVLSALEFGEVTEDTVIDTSKRIMRLGGRRVGDPRNYGKQTPADILVNSSNLGTSMLALSLPKEFFLDKFFQAGFGESTGINLIGESQGIMHTRSRWSQIELATLSYGMGVSATPIQMARFYASIANGGVKKPLSILKREKVNSYDEQRIFSEKNTESLLGMLEQVVEQKAHRAKVEGYRVGGKTGTAFKAVAGGYGNDYVGLFTGIAPISDPKIVVIVVINEPGGDLYHGGEIAAPVFSRVMQGALRLLNIEPDADTRVVSANDDNGGKRV